MSSPRVRVAASLTGTLRALDARVALFSWLAARSAGGNFLLRIKDSGAAPVDDGREDLILDDLRWLGLGWDEGDGRGPYRRSERPELYVEWTERLIERGAAYPCFCSGARPEQDTETGLNGAPLPPEADCCRAIPPAGAAARRRKEPHAVRFKSDRRSAAAGVGFEDLVQGRVLLPAAGSGDFVLLGADGSPSDDLADVVDDIAMGITHVIRDGDPQANAMRQVLLHAALAAGGGPRFAHLPAVRTVARDAQEDRGAATPVAWFRGCGYPPEALVNYLALLGWSPPAGGHLLTREELIAVFRIDDVSRSSSAFDHGDLDALSARHMARLPPERVQGLAIEHLVRAALVRDPVPPDARVWLGRLAMLYADRVTNMSDLASKAACLFDFSAERCLANQEVRRVLTDVGSRRVVRTLVECMQHGPMTAPLFQSLVEEVRRSTGSKGRDLYHPLRIALTGSDSGPDLVKLVPIIDEGSVLALQRRIASCRERATALFAATAGGVAQ